MVNLLKWLLNPLPFLVLRASLLILLENIDGTVGMGRESRETILMSDAKLFSKDHNQTAHPSASPPLWEEGWAQDQHKKGDDDGNECRDNKQLQHENDNFSRLIMKMDASIHNQTWQIKNLEELEAVTKELIKETKIELARFTARHFRDSQGNTKLHLAAQKGEVQAVKNLLLLGADVNATNSNSETPIILAAGSTGDANMTLKIVKLLVNHRADVFATDGEGHTFLHKIASRGRPLTPVQFQDLAEFIISKNISMLFNIRETALKRTPLMLVSRTVKLDKEAILLLHRNGVDISLVDETGSSYLTYAFEGRKNMTLLPELNGNKTLEDAIKDMDEDSVKMLVRSGADVNEKNSNLQRPLHLAARLRTTSSAINMIKFLINSGADVYAKDEDNETFLHILLARSSTLTPTQFHDLVTFLISKDLSILFTTPGRGTATPFQWAVRKIEIERATLSLLKNDGVDFNAVDERGESVLFWATKAEGSHRRFKLVADLVDLGANPKQLRGDKRSMLHVAALVGNVMLLRFFLDKGLNVNGRDESGYTPIFLALYDTRRSQKDVYGTVRFLLKNGANSGIVNDRGDTPLDYFNEMQRYGPYANRGMIATCLSLGSLC